MTTVEQLEEEIARLRADRDRLAALLRASEDLLERRLRDARTHIDNLLGCRYERGQRID